VTKFESLKVGKCRKRDGLLSAILKLQLYKIEIGVVKNIFFYKTKLNGLATIARITLAYLFIQPVE